MPSTNCFPHHLHRILSLNLKPYSYLSQGFIGLDLRLAGSYKWQCNSKAQVSINHWTPTTRPSEKHIRVPLLWWRWKKMVYSHNRSLNQYGFKLYVFILSFEVPSLFNSHITMSIIRVYITSLLDYNKVRYPYKFPFWYIFMLSQVIYY